MQLRTARRGPNAGNQFWGCSTYPRCRGTLDLDDLADGDDATASDDQNTRMSTRYLPVNWEAKSDRNDWWTEYCSVGALPGVARPFIELDHDIKRSLSQFILFTNRQRREQQSRPTNHAALVSGLFIKMLQRGKTPHVSLSVEKKALSAHKLMDHVEHPSSGEVGWELKQEHLTKFVVTTDELIEYLSVREEFKFDSEIDFGNKGSSIFDSDLESKFISEWVPSAIHPSAGHWFIPQAPLDRIIESSGREMHRDRRVDFVFCHPAIQPFIVEIDGPDHSDKIDSDSERDGELNSAGIEVIRVPNTEIISGEGEQLNVIVGKVSHLFPTQVSENSENDIVSMISDCLYAAKLQFAIARAIKYGWLTTGSIWKICLDQELPTAIAAITDTLEILDAYDAIYSGSSVPKQCIVIIGKGKSSVIARNDKGKWVAKRSKLPAYTNADELRVSIQQYSSPYHEICVSKDTDFIVRPTYLPVDVLSEHLLTTTRPQIKANNHAEIKPALETILQHIFRKKQFRDMQCNAIYNILKKIDTIVLLPTGAGKSLIYQLAGMIMPGITLVVDPLTALIEDQIESMDKMGIDRTLGIASAIASRSERVKSLRCAERGEYYFLFLGPEQLQSPSTCRSLETVHHEFLFNVAVIDEVHCVSEWGHDFRPSYLTVTDNINKVGRASDMSVPPLLGLTGTASRAVLRDLLATLNIDKDDSTSVIRPISFDRKELEFDIKKTPSASNVLQAVLSSLPDKFQYPRNKFYSTSGKNTQSGVIFTPHVNGNYGILAVKSIVSSICRSVTLYSGEKPKEYGNNTSWNTEKSKNAKAFKNNEVVALVATKAFGMGIDKPNIRYTIHFGMPRSLEAFYQEAGRAGRDGLPSICTILYSERNEHRSDQLLDLNLGLEELRSLHKRYSNRSTDDDVMRAIWFHLQNFSGVESHFVDIKKVANDLGLARTDSITDETTLHSTAREMAVYRLKTLGMITSYTIDWSAKKIICNAVPFDREKAIDSLEEYVRSTDPARAKIIRSKAEKVTNGSRSGELQSLVRILVDYIYEDIEKSRRRMIREAFLFARNVSNDQEMRQRMLSYLQEGFEYGNLEQLLDQEEISFDHFIDVAMKPKFPIEADELRGMCTRLLESSPNHPGLLIARSIAESKCHDSESTTIQADIATALRNSVLSYGIEDDQIYLLFERILSIKDDRFSISATLALVRYEQTAIEQQDDPDYVIDITPIMNQFLESGNSECRYVVLAWKLSHLLDSLQHSISQTETYIDANDILNKVQSRTGSRSPSKPKSRKRNSSPTDKH